MSDAVDRPDASEPLRDKEYQDFRYHDDEDTIGGDDPEYRRTRPPVKRQPFRKPPTRRPYYED
jgi:hypothetical protein